MKEEQWFKNSKDDNLCGIISNPTDDVSKPVVIVVPGFNGTKEDSTTMLFERRFNQEYISTFRFDFYGHGKSDGKIEDATVSEAIDDISQATNFLKNKGYSRFGLIGSSFGGLASIVTVSKSKDYLVLGLRAPAVNFYEQFRFKYGKKDLKTWKEEDFIVRQDRDGKNIRINYSFYDDAVSYNGYIAGKKIFIPTIIVHGTEDHSVPVGQSKKLYKIIKNSKIIIYPKSNHQFEYGTDRKDSINAMVNFFVDQMQ